MKFKSRMQRMAALIEIILGATLAIFFHFVLHDRVAAFTIFGVGLLLSLSTWLLREDITEILAGDICACVGLKQVSTGDTICDEKHPVLLERIDFPAPVIQLAIEPK